ncbi:hypothetical protein KKD80_00425 [Patescibacteria group bacterium]|nr:hypothetical protein [Patescibacteria group bacterium]
MDPLFAPALWTTQKEMPRQLGFFLVGTDGLHAIVPAAGTEIARVAVNAVTFAICRNAADMRVALQRNLQPRPCQATFGSRSYPDTSYVNVTPRTKLSLPPRMPAIRTKIPVVPTQFFFHFFSSHHPSSEDRRHVLLHDLPYLICNCGMPDFF